MREIKTHRTGGLLNEAIKIETDDEYKYTVMVKAHGSWQQKFKLEFQDDRLHSEETGGPDGLSDEVLLAILIDRFEQRFTKNLVHGEVLARERLKEALFWLRDSLNERPQ